MCINCRCQLDKNVAGEQYNRPVWSWMNEAGVQEVKEAKNSDQRQEGKASSLPHARQAEANHIWPIECSSPCSAYFQSNTNDVAQTVWYTTALPRHYQTGKCTDKYFTNVKQWWMASNSTFTVAEVILIKSYCTQDSWYTVFARTQATRYFTYFGNRKNKCRNELTAVAFGDNMAIVANLTRIPNGIRAKACQCYIASILNYNCSSSTWPRFWGEPELKTVIWRHFQLK